MELAHLQQYSVPALLVLFFGWRFFRRIQVRRQLPGLLARGAVVVDVRSRNEFASAASAGSINIPLDEIEQGIKELDRHKPVVLCCASGTRSMMASKILKQRGFDCVINAGPWKNTIL